MKKKILLFMIGVLFLTGCGHSEDTLVNKDVNLKDLYLEVLLNQRSYIDQNGMDMDFHGYMNSYSEAMEFVPASYAYVDLNGDGYEEMVVAADASDRFYLILHYEKEKVYGYELNGRSMIHIKTDGSYYASGGAGYGSIQKMLFSGTKLTERSVARHEGNLYYIGDSAVTANQYATYFNEFSTKKNVEFLGSKAYSTKEKSKSIYGTYYLLDKKGSSLRDGSGTIRIMKDGRCEFTFQKKNRECRSFEKKKEKICFHFSNEEKECYTFKNQSLVQDTTVYQKSS